MSSRESRPVGAAGGDGAGLTVARGLGPALQAPLLGDPVPVGGHLVCHPDDPAQDAVGVRGEGVSLRQEPVLSGARQGGRYLSVSLLG